MSDDLSGGGQMPAFVHMPHDPPSAPKPLPDPAPAPSPQQTQEPAPEPAPAPAPEEPKGEPIRPTWLSEVMAEPEPAPMPTNHPSAPAPAAPQYRPPANSDERLNSFVQDPDGYIGSAVARAIEDVISPIRRDMAALGYGTAGMFNAQMKSVSANAAASVDRVYETVFNKDPVFRTNQAVADRVDKTMKGMMADAIQKARQGDPTDLYTLSNMTDSQAAASLAAVKTLLGVKPAPVSAAPAADPRMVVERPSAPVQDEGVQLPPDLAEVAKRLSPAKAQQLKQEYANTLQRGDVSWNE